MKKNKQPYKRDENCLNCGLPIIGSFCASCGQKAHLHKDSFFHMVQHFIGDYFHYDGKFILTLKSMLTAPGKVTLDYINGKRARFINPIQLYFFVSTVFFLFVAPLNGKQYGTSEIDKKATANFGLKYTPSDSNKAIATQKEKDLDSLLEATENDIGIGIGQFNPTQKSYEEYLQNQDTLAKSEQDGWFVRKIIKQAFHIKETKKNGDNIGKKYKTTYSKLIPKCFFLLLPFFALLLKIIFRKKNLFYVDHCIYSLHFHSITFIAIGILIILNYFFSGTLQTITNIIITIGLLLYFIMSLKLVYKDSWIKTIVKSILLASIYFLTFSITLLLLFGVSYFML